MKQSTFDFHNNYNKFDLGLDTTPPKDGSFSLSLTKHVYYANTAGYCVNLNNTKFLPNIKDVLVFRIESLSHYLAPTPTRPHL